MPSMPIPLRASFTSSSLNGWMMASIFFIGAVRYQLSRFKYIPLFTVHAGIQALDLLFLINPHTDGGIDDFQNDERAHNRQRPRDQAADKLIAPLCRVALHEPGRLSLPRRVLQTIVDEVRRKNTGKNRAQRSARAMYAERVERVIVSELALDARHHEVADHACAQTNQHRGEGLHESARGRDRDKTRHASRDRAEYARLARVDPLDEHPRQRRRSRTEVCGHKRARCQTARRQRTACVETEPADPQQARADRADHQIVRLHLRIWLSHSPPP